LGDLMGEITVEKYAESGIYKEKVATV
jgi:hypothetical protein